MEKTELNLQPVLIYVNEVEAIANWKIEKLHLLARCNNWRDKKEFMACLEIRKEPNDE